MAASWRDQLLELDLPGVGAITASALSGPEGAGPEEPVSPREQERHEEAFRRRAPTSPPEAGTVRATLRARAPLALEHSWLVVPALGPVLPASGPGGTVVADLTGREPPTEVRPRRADPPAVRPSREGVLAGAPVPQRPGDRRGQGVRPPERSWYRRPVVARELRRRGGAVALGALVGPRRDWFEPAVAAREDLLAPHPDQALESALAVAAAQGQAAVLRIGPAGLDLHPTRADPRVPALSGLALLVTARPAQCPLQGEDGCGPCRPVGGRWIRAAQTAQIAWEARRSQALAVLDCGVCFGEALPPEPDQPPVPRMGRRAPVPEIDRLHLRGGEVVRIDPIAPPRR
ncbi:hypothetical protein ACT3SP_09560 [Brachybacterium sp. AOP43-C2-M15]|uniref:hypothetical protein n=1 Tax=Brachybacterium sp. AOP43-C2-M15 TaxID=3457661 RepID=UPI0040332F3C